MFKNLKFIYSLVYMASYGEASTACTLAMHGQGDIVRKEMPHLSIYADLTEKHGLFTGRLASAIIAFGWPLQFGHRFYKNMTEK